MLTFLELLCSLQQFFLVLMTPKAEAFKTGHTDKQKKEY
jgi:hypothetical protein